jgi:hypothetical protein
MPTTTNFGWTTPADTDLVKDGAAAIRTLGSNIDTSLVDLKGGTTGQYLQKNSGTDLDYVWANVSAGGMTLLSTTTLSGASTTVSSISQDYTNLLVIVDKVNLNSNGAIIVRFNGTTYNLGYTGTDGGSFNAQSNPQEIILRGGNVNMLSSNTDNIFSLTINNYSSTTRFKSFLQTGYFVNTDSAYRGVGAFGGATTDTAVSSLQFYTGDTFNGGTVLIYGVK